MLHLQKALCVLACSAIVTAAHAQQGAVPTAGTRPMPEVQTQNGVKFMCGGIGMIEAARMRQIAADYDLLLTFAAGNGAYLADIDVSISGPDDTSLVTTRCNGPLMLVDMPRAGSYRIRAESEGMPVTRKVRVTAGQAGKRLSVTWPVSAGADSSTAAR